MRADILCKIRWLHAKGAVTVNVELENNALKSAQIIPDFEGQYIFKYKDQTINVTAKAAKNKIFCCNQRRRAVKNSA